MAITVAQLHLDLDAARTALVAGDFATALTYCRAALAVLSGLPNSQTGDSRAEWRDTINELIKACESGASHAVSTTAAGIQRTKVTYIEATD